MSLSKVIPVKSDQLKEIAEIMAGQLEKYALRKVTYTAKEAAYILSISTCWLYELIRKGEFEVVSMGKREMRVSVVSVDAFVDRGGVKSKETIANREQVYKRPVKHSESAIPQ